MSKRLFFFKPEDKPRHLIAKSKYSRGDARGQEYEMEIFVQIERQFQLEGKS